MLKPIRLLFLMILILMVGVTIWASLEKNIMEGFNILFQERWGIATLADAYCGFLTFYVWVFYKETGWSARIGWLIAIMIFGNIAMASYVLKTVWKLGPNSKYEDLLLRNSA